jgi:hypothetical protein
MSLGHSEDIFLSYDFEDEKQLDFPSIEIEKSNEVTHAYYGINLDRELDSDNEKIKLQKIVTLPKGTKVKLSGYIVAKEFFESIRFKSAGNKTNEAEMKTILNSHDSIKINNYLFKIAEKWRTPEDDTETAWAAKKIQDLKTDDSVSSTATIPTGFIEVMPERNEAFKGKENVRFFIPLKEIKKLSMNPKNSELKLKKAVAILAFKRLRSSLNFGDLNDDKIAEIDQLETKLSAPCTENCIINNRFPLLGDFVVNTFKATLAAALNEDLVIGDEYNLKILKSLEEQVHLIFGACPQFKNVLLSK